MTLEAVLDVAAEIANREGINAVTLAAVADELNIRPPSLYSHIAGLDGLRREMCLRAFRSLSEYCAAVVDEGDDPEVAVRRVCHAYRHFAHDHPGLYQSMITGRDLAADDELWSAGANALSTVLDSLQRLGLDGEDLWHAFRILRASLHGFVSLETRRGFALDVDQEASFDRLTEVLLVGLRGTFPTSSVPHIPAPPRAKTASN